VSVESQETSGSINTLGAAAEGAAERLNGVSGSVESGK